MGEYAEYALAAAMRHGSPVRQWKGPATPPKPCPLCAKELRGGFCGMVAHLKAKHGRSDRNARTLALIPTPETPK